MNISFITEYNALDIHNWSGLGFNIAKALEKQDAKLNYIGNLEVRNQFSDFVKKVFYRGLGKIYLDNRTINKAKQLGRQADQYLKLNTDIVFSPGSLPIAFMRNHFPKVFYTDATFAGLLDFYPGFSNLSSETIKMGHFLEQKALDNCVLAIYSSEWAAKSALDKYVVDPSKIKVVPFGANVNTNRSFSDIERIVEGRAKSVCKLLFIGVDWKRKGGNLALKVARELTNKGLKTELHLVGTNENLVSSANESIVNHGFISKSTLNGAAKIESLFAQSHYLILPSLADCSPLVLNEAGSFGLPTICSNVGGITSIIKNDINGRTFSVNADANEYTTFILANFNDPYNYKKLAYDSFHEYEKRLNWDVNGRILIELLSEYSNVG